MCHFMDGRVAQDVSKGTGVVIFRVKQPNRLLDAEDGSTTICRNARELLTQRHSVTLQKT